MPAPGGEHGGCGTPTLWAAAEGQGHDECQQWSVSWQTVSAGGMLYIAHTLQSTEL